MLKSFNVMGGATRKKMEEDGWQFKTLTMSELFTDSVKALSKNTPKQFFTEKGWRGMLGPVVIINPAGEKVLPWDKEYTDARETAWQETLKEPGYWD